jgi:hypothetical protein
MSGKYKTFVVGIIIILVVVAGLHFFKKRSGTEVKTDAQTGTNLEKASTDEQKELISQKKSGNVMEGTLKLSDNKKKGNLMLVMPDRTLYLSTTRDFSQLIGKQVEVSYEGTLEDFVLGNIILK